MTTLIDELGKTIGQVTREFIGNLLSVDSLFRIGAFYYGGIPEGLLTLFATSRPAVLKSFKTLADISNTKAIRQLDDAIQAVTPEQRKVIFEAIGLPTLEFFDLRNK